MSEAGTPNQNDVVARAMKLVDNLTTDPKLGPDVRKRAKELFSDIHTVEDDVDPLVAPIRQSVSELAEQNKKILERLEARDKADADAKAEIALSEKLARARSEFGLTDDGYAKMIDRMKATGNLTDPEAAAAYIVSKAPKPQPTSTPSFLPQSANLFGSSSKSDDADLIALHRDPEAYLEAQLREFVADPVKYTNETLANG